MVVGKRKFDVLWDGAAAPVRCTKNAIRMSEVHQPILHHNAAEAEEAGAAAPPNQPGVVLPPVEHAEDVPDHGSEASSDVGSDSEASEADAPQDVPEVDE